MSPIACSVVIPAFNAAAFIEKTLDSIRQQTFGEYEIIVVDDGSSDDTQSIVERYLDRHKITGTCIRQANKKIAGARNTGMQAARGDFIALLDHDDLWYPQKLAVVMREFELHPEVDLICHNENIIHHGRILRASSNGPWVPKMYEHLLFRGNVLSPSATVLRKEKALSIGGFRENAAFDTAEDYDFWMRLSQVAMFYFLDLVLGEYHIVDRAASRRIEYHHANMEYVLLDHFAAYFENCPGPLDRSRIRRRLSAVYRSAVTQLMAHNESPEKQKEYVVRMLREFPLEPKNLARAALWYLRSLRATSVTQIDRKSGIGDRWI